MGWYTSHAESEVSGVRLLAEEVTPTMVDLARSFLVPRPSIFKRIRLLKIREVTGRVRGWKQCYLLGGETGLAGERIPIPADLGLSSGAWTAEQTIVVHAYLIPPPEQLDEWTDGELCDLFLSLAAKSSRDDDNIRRNARPLFHHEDEVLSATVVEHEGKFCLYLGFDLVIRPQSDTYYCFEAMPVPPPLRHHVAEEAVIEPSTWYETPERLVAIAKDLAEGRIAEYTREPWEEPHSMDHFPRRLFRTVLPSGVLAFGTIIDCADRPPLATLLEKLSKQR